jgi:hypothetical protein
MKCNNQRRNIIMDINNAGKQMNSQEELKPGTTMADGTMFGGVTSDNKYRIFITPKDLGVAMGFNRATKRIARLAKKNAYGHDDWQMGSKDVMEVLRENRDKGFLRGIFNGTWKSKSALNPMTRLSWRYWTSTKDEEVSRWTIGGGRAHDSYNYVNFRDDSRGYDGVSSSGFSAALSGVVDGLYSAIPVRLTPIPAPK